MKLIIEIEVSEHKDPFVVVKEIKQALSNYGRQIEVKTENGELYSQYA